MRGKLTDYMRSDKRRKRYHFFAKNVGGLQNFFSAPSSYPDGGCSIVVVTTNDDGLLLRRARISLSCVRPRLTSPYDLLLEVLP